MAMMIDHYSQWDESVGELDEESQSADSADDRQQESPHPVFIAANGEDPKEKRWSHEEITGIDERDGRGTDGIADEHSKE